VRVPRACVLALVAVGVLLTAGCAQRGVTSEPPPGTGGGTWAAVIVAAVAATVVLAALIVLPDRRRGGSLVASAVLGLQAAGVAVGGAILVGAAIRSEQLLGRPPDAEQAASLLHLTGLDGRDVGFFRLVAGLTIVLGVLLVAVLALAARCAADTDTVERTLASCILATEVVASITVGVLMIVFDDHSLPYLLPAASLPILVFALVRCWPPRATT
jgi:hypothetical protein